MSRNGGPFLKKCEIECGDIIIFDFETPAEIQVIYDDYHPIDGYQIYKIRYLEKGETDRRNFKEFILWKKDKIDEPEVSHEYQAKD